MLNSFINNPKSFDEKKLNFHPTKPNNKKNLKKNQKNSNFDGFRIPANKSDDQTKNKI